MKTITCPHCYRSEQQVKVGYNPSGSQRYKCKVCARKYTPERKPQGYAPEIRAAAVRQAVDGGNYRRIGRALGVDHQSVANWVNACSQTLPDVPPIPEGELAVNEMDELFTFIGAKKTLSTS